jgi:hypothetical protein
MWQAAGKTERHLLRPLIKEPTASYRSDKIKQNSELHSKLLPSHVRL